MPIDERSPKQFKSPADDSQPADIVQPGSPIEKNDNVAFEKHIDNLTDDELTGDQVCSDDTLKHSGREDEEQSIKKNKSISRHCYEHDSSDNEDDEVNDLFKEVRRMSNQSASNTSSNTSRKSNNGRTKYANPFLEPFHRHSSVDMKGILKWMSYFIFVFISTCEAPLG